jgi:hypothetical protein
VEQHDFVMEIISADGNGGTFSSFSIVTPPGHSRVRVRHRVRRLVVPELPDDDPDSGSTVLEDWVDLDLDAWNSEE